MDYSNNIHHRLENNDAELVELTVGRYDFLPSDGNWESLGVVIGRNTHLRRLIFRSPGGMPDGELREFFRGVSLNKSLNEFELKLKGGDVSSRRIFSFLLPSFLNKRISIRLKIFFCPHSRIWLIASALEAFDSLTEFHLIVDCRKVQPTSMVNVIKALAGHPNLEKIRLAGAKIGPKVISALSDLLNNEESKLALLDLSNTGITNDTVSTIATGLNGNSSLRELCLSNNSDISEQAWQAMFDALQHPSCGIEKLSLRFTNAAASPSLHMALINISTLRSLDLGHNKKVAIGSWKVLFYFIGSPLCNLEEINLSGCELNGQLLSCLAESLVKNPCVKKLFLQSNGKVCQVGWLALSGSIRNPHCQLEEIDLSDCVLLDDSSIACIADSLAENTSVKELRLCHNRNITAAGWQALSTALQCNLSMEILDLSYGTIDDDGINFLARGIPSKLRQLNISGAYSVTSAGWIAFDVILRNPDSALESLDLRDNSIDSETIASFATSLANNHTLTKLLITPGVIDDEEIFDDCVNTAHLTTFQPLLCDGSSIMTTYLSNHSLQQMCYDEEEEEQLPGELKYLLLLNMDNTKSQAARLKIIKTHFNRGYVVPPFVGMEAKVLPSAISWMGRGGRSNEVDGHFYEFVRSVAWLFDKADEVKMGSEEGI